MGCCLKKQSHSDIPASQSATNTNQPTNPAGMPVSYMPPSSNFNAELQPIRSPQPPQPVPSYPGTNQNHPAAPGYQVPKTHSEFIPQSPQKGSGSEDPNLPFTLKQILFLINDIRSSPAKYAPRIETLFLSKMDASGLNLETRVMANEGRSAFEEAVRYLKSAGALPPLKLSAGLTAAALTHSEDLARRNTLSHTGSDRSQPSDRVEKFCTVAGNSWGSGENILDDPTMDPEVWLLRFIIDDGVRDRGHRRNVMTSEFDQVGFGVAKGQQVYFTIDFATGYASNQSAITRSIRERSGLTFYEASNPPAV